MGIKKYHLWTELQILLLFVWTLVNFLLSIWPFLLVFMIHQVKIVNSFGNTAHNSQEGTAHAQESAKVAPPRSLHRRHLVATIRNIVFRIEWESGATEMVNVCYDQETEPAWWGRARTSPPPGVAANQSVPAAQYEIIKISLPSTYVRLVEIDSDYSGYIANIGLFLFRKEPI